MSPREIKAALIAAGVHQNDIAGELDVSPVTVHQVIQGTSTSKRIAKKISEKINKPVDEIWPGKYKEEEAA